MKYKIIITRYHKRVRVAAKRISQKPREHRVPVWNEDVIATFAVARLLSCKIIERQNFNINTLPPTSKKLFFI